MPDVIIPEYLQSFLRFTGGLIMNRTSLIRGSATILIIVVAILAVHAAWLRYTTSPWTRDGRVRADIVRVSADVSGLVTALKVKDNQQVKEGDVLFIVDRDRYLQQVERAKADLAYAKADEQAALANTAMAQANVNANLSRYKMEKERAERRERMNDMVSAETIHDSRSAAITAEAELRQSQAANKQAAANIIKAQAAVQQAQASLDMAQLDYERAEVKAAADGTVTNLDIKEGDYINTGVPALALLKNNSMWVYGYFEETKIPSVHVGDRAEVKLMAGDLTIPGVVDSIASGIADTAAATSSNMLADITPTFSWIRLAQRIPVRVRIDTSKIPAGFSLVAGMSASVAVRPAENNNEE